ncbi:hypothetical protein BGX34_005732 [Mortierella sp. NVP85]|nr:hypothetical protein BGX34_005732 [Mortierella sp. NVP85]
MVLKSMGRRITKNPDQVIAITRLLNAIEKGKAMVQYSYQSNSAKISQDWREALGVLETWAPADLPNSPESESTITQEGNEHDVPSLQSPPSLQPPQTFKVTDELLRQELSTWLTSLMKRLVYSHTYKIRSMLDTIPQRFGIETTVDMYLVLMDYYSKLGRDGRKDIFALIIKMNNENVKWKHERAVYHHLLNSLSQMSGNEVEAEKIIDHMLASNLVPKEDTMRAVIMCAARSGDLEACSRYIHKMHQEWNLTISERVKSILLYACAVRGDFDSSLEIFAQLNQAKAEKRVTPKDSNSRIALKSTPRTSPSTFTDIEGTLSTQDVVDNSNILLALINQTHARRGHKKRISQEFLKEEVHKVLQLFTIVTKDPNQVDTQLYSIMMQYLSTLPSPLPGMMYLYKEMCMLENAQPNGITYRIMLDACAEQMDMDQAKQLWSDMDANHIPKSSLIRASYVKGWGRTGDLETAERIAREGMFEQERLEQDLLRRQSEPVVRSKERQDPLSTLLNPRRLQRERQVTKMIGSGVLHELMTAHKVHNQPERVYELYREMEAGKWGVGISPNEKSLAIVLEASGSSSATAKLVDQSIDLVEQFLEKQRYRHLQLQGNGAMDLKKGHGDSHEADNHRDEPSSEDHGLFDSETIPGMHPPMALSDANYRLYYIMLGRHHRQRKMVEVWDDMMKWIKRPPSRLTFKVVTEALENVQWGAAPIKRIRRQLKERWPDIGWTSTAGRGRRGGRNSASRALGLAYDPSDEDESVGAGGRFWR